MKTQQQEEWNGRQEGGILASEVLRSLRRPRRSTVKYECANPFCGAPAEVICTRRVVCHVPELDADPTVERLVHVSLTVCHVCGTRFIVPRLVVQLPVRATELRYLAPDLKASETQEPLWWQLPIFKLPARPD